MSSKEIRLKKQHQMILDTYTDCRRMATFYRAVDFIKNSPCLLKLTTKLYYLLDGGTSIDSVSHHFGRTG